MTSDWEKFGKDVQHIVEDAINSQDFSQLNKTIKNTVNEAAASIRDGLRTAEHSVNHEFRRKNYRWYGENNDRQKDNGQTVNAGYGAQGANFKPEASGRKAELAAPALFRKDTGIKAGGWAMTITGCILNTGIGIAVVILCLVSLLLGGFPVGIRIALSILLPFLAVSAVMTGMGGRMRASVKRYRTYISGLKGRTYCNIKELADLSGKSVSYVVKDLKKMIKKGWFIQGHLDRENTCLMVSHETYREYENLRKQRLEQQKSEQLQKQEDAKRADKMAENESLREVMEKGQDYIRKIKACNDAIPGEEISGKISHMEMLIQKIFDRVREDPESLDDINKMMEYYLPTTVKLLEAYQSLDEQPVQGENIRTSKVEIEQTLDTLNEAFERLLDSLFEDVAWDVSSDISVLHTMLAQEGLAGTQDWKRPQ